MIIWLIGMSGAGKTTVGLELYKMVKQEHKNTLFLDGDLFRKIMGDDLGHGMDDRRKNAERFCRLSQYLAEHDIHAVCAFLSLFPESREWNKVNIKDYFEVFLDVQFETLVRRDAKGIYAKALRGEMKNVVGIDIPYPRPTSSDLVICNEGDKSAQDVAVQILQVLKRKGL